MRNSISLHCCFWILEDYRPTKTTIKFWKVVEFLNKIETPVIRETYETLANDMQWKVRRTVASSIHELGVILGEEIAAEDLVPIFDGFIKDLDEVCI